MGNSSGNLDAWAAAFEAHPAAQGGFIWDWVDQGLTLTLPLPLLLPLPLTLTLTLTLTPTLTLT